MNIITAAINSFGKSTTCPLYQWDYGQILMITGITLPDAYEVNFAQGSETCTVIGTAEGVEIPDEYLQNASDIIAYLYLHTGETDGETVYELTIPVIARPEPSHEEPTPVQQSEITQLVAALNTAVGEAEGYAQDAQEAAESIPQHVLVYDEQTLTNAEKTQARANIGAIGSADIPTEIFWVTYQSTTAQQISSAISSGKYPVLKYGNGFDSPRIIAPLTNQFDSYTFECVQGSEFIQFVLSSGTWSMTRIRDHNIKYDAQSLTTSQKSQARTNIGAASDGQVTDLKGAFIDEIRHVELLTGKSYEYGWVSGKTINTNTSTGAFSITDYPGRRYTGPFKSYVDFSVTATYGYSVAVIATEDGNAVLNTSWFSGKRTYTCNSNYEYYVLCNFDNDDYVPTIESDAVYARKLPIASVVQQSIDENPFYFVRGKTDDGVTIKYSEYTMVTQNIIKLSFDMIIPVNTLTRITVWTFDDADGTNPSEHANANESADYTVKADTYFRLYVRYRSGVTGYKMSDNFGMYDTAMYKTLVLYAKGMEGYNLINTVQNTIQSLKAIDVNPNIKTINHRGYNVQYPENTLIAFQASRRRGFSCVETDVRFTSDGVAVLLHDGTINRTGRNPDGTAIGTTIRIADITYAQAKTYDFGKYKENAAGGTYSAEIPTFEDFLKLCKKTGLTAYIELKVGTAEQIANLVMIAKKIGMIDRLSWISYNSVLLGYVKDNYPKARLGCINNDITETAIPYATALRNSENEVFYDVAYSALTDAKVRMLIDAGLPMEVFTVNTISDLDELNPYYTGITTDCLNASVYLYYESI